MIRKYQTDFSRYAKQQYFDPDILNALTTTVKLLFESFNYREVSCEAIKNFLVKTVYSLKWGKWLVIKKPVQIAVEYLQADLEKLRNTEKISKCFEER